MEPGRALTKLVRFDPEPVREDLPMGAALPETAPSRLFLSGNEAVALAVRDAGCGLAPEVERRLFETFFTTKPQGLGLGLSICRTIVESHGGRMWANGNDGPGLTMRFTLPAAEAEAT